MLSRQHLLNLSNLLFRDTENIIFLYGSFLFIKAYSYRMGVPYG